MPNLFRQKLYSEYTGSGRVVRDTYLSKAVIDPSGHVHVFFKGTHPTKAHEWAEDAKAAAGRRIPNWDKELQWYIDNYGYESSNVTYTGFSRGGGLAQYMGGTGYGSGHFHRYPPRDGSKNNKSGYAGSLWSKFNAMIHNDVIEPISGDIDRLDGIADSITGFDPRTGEPHSTTGSSKLKEHPMAPISNRGRSLITVQDERGNVTFASGTQMDPDGHPHAEPMDTSQSIALGKRKYSEISADSSHPLQSGGDFSGLVSTFLNPITGRIIGYKGIPRKHKFISLERYSPFWKEQNRLTQTSVLAGPA